MIKVGPVAGIPEGEMRSFDLPAETVAVAHVQSHLFAFSDQCTAHGCCLSDGTLDIRARTVKCATDSSVFDIETGEPLEGPAQDRLDIYLVHETEGWVEVSPYALSE